MSLKELAKQTVPPPVLVVGGSGGSGYQAALDAAREWSQDEVIDWGRVKIVMSDQPGEGQLGIKELRSVLNLKPGKPQAVLVCLDGAGVEVQNALLKRFEEPTSDTWIVALASGLSHVLPTIRSRCQILRVAPLGQDEIQAWMSEREIELGDDLVALCGADLDLLAWCAENPRWTQAAREDDIAALLAALRESESAGGDALQMIKLLGLSGHHMVEEARKILARGAKPEAALALASLS